MLKSSLWDNSDAYVLWSGTITVTWAGANDIEKRLDKRNKGVIFKNWATFTNSISEINITQTDNAKHLDALIPIHDLIEYSDNYSKTSRSLWQYYKDNPSDNMIKSESFKSKIKIAGKVPATGNTKDIKIKVPLKYLSYFWRTLKMPLINWEINLILTWSGNCVISSVNGATKFKITDTKLYVPVENLLTQDNAKPLQQLKSGFKTAIDWKKYQPEVSTKRQS